MSRKHRGATQVADVATRALQYVILDHINSNCWYQSELMNAKNYQIYDRKKNVSMIATACAMISLYNALYTIRVACLAAMCPE